MRGFDRVVLEHQREKLEQVAEDLERSLELDWEEDGGRENLAAAREATADAASKLTLAIEAMGRQLAKTEPEV